MLYETVKLRAKSIAGQLDGSIPSTDAGQRKDSSSFIDASHINLEAMGKFSMGGGGFGDFGGRSDSDTEESSESNFAGRSRRGANNPRKGFFARQAASSDSESAESNSNAGTVNESSFGGFPPTTENGERPSSSGMPGEFSGSSQSTQSTLIMYGILLMVMIVLLFALKKLKRRS